MEASRYTAQTAAQPDHAPPLADQAKGLPRRAVMKGVVGPALTEFLHPLYVPTFSAEEMEHIPADSSFPDLSSLVWGIESVVKKRLKTEMDDNLAGYIELAALRHAREDLFFNFAEIFPGSDFKDNLEDSINSGIMIPIVVAVDILRLESGDKPDSPSNVLDKPFDHQAIIDIMQRDSFDRILSRLAKGPNNFITAYLSDPSKAFRLWPSESKKADSFFGFRKGYG